MNGPGHPVGSTGAEDLPVIGEPPAVELANTDYGVGPTAIDFLAGPADIERWLAHAPLCLPVAPPAFAGGDAVALRDLRDATRRALVACADGTEPPADAVAVLNARAARAPFSERLDRGGDHDGGEPGEDDLGPGVLRVRRVPAPGRPADVVLGWLATAAIGLVGGPDRDLVRRCEGPGCTMLFVRRHHRRRWCDPSCGHRARQASYYRRRTARDRATPEPTDRAVAARRERP
ncbi:MAG: CGNR zinc finger domain-containing protein [Actinomycetota bacterium]|nr:CGNR zinc finger domain-containing protein [Actinomycetota bacterium]